MNSATDSFILKGGHVLDAEQGIDKIADVHVAGGKIQHVGSREAAADTKIVDVSGNYVSPAGWTSMSTPMGRSALPIPIRSASIKA